MVAQFDLSAQSRVDISALRREVPSSRRRSNLRRPAGRMMTLASNPACRYETRLPLPSLARVIPAMLSFGEFETERASYNGSIEASQASDVGSIPIARSIHPESIGPAASLSTVL